MDTPRALGGLGTRSVCWTKLKMLCASIRQFLYVGSWLSCWWLTLLSLDFQHLYNFWPLIAGLDLTLILNFPHAFCSRSLKCLICVTPSSLSQSQKRNWIKTGSDSAVHGVAESWTWLSNEHLQKRNRLLFSFVPFTRKLVRKIVAFCLAGDLDYFKE